MPVDENLTPDDNFPLSKRDLISLFVSVCNIEIGKTKVLEPRTCCTDHARVGF